MSRLSSSSGAFATRRQLSHVEGCPTAMRPFDLLVDLASLRSPVKTAGHEVTATVLMVQAAVCHLNASGTHHKVIGVFDASVSFRICQFSLLTVGNTVELQQPVLEAGAPTSSQWRRSPPVAPKSLVRLTLTFGQVLRPRALPLRPPTGLDPLDRSNVVRGNRRQQMIVQFESLCDPEKTFECRGMPRLDATQGAHVDPGRFGQGILLDVSGKANLGEATPNLTRQLSLIKIHFCVPLSKYED